ncbi:hypothetical protein DFH06DRAFT_615476 [Mycena polygramma]|nr:hypothetical protein DFH06DRAFT_615476 [Mycena polygramma]
MHTQHAARCCSHKCHDALARTRSSPPPPRSMRRALSAQRRRPTASLEFLASFAPPVRDFRSASPLSSIRAAATTRPRWCTKAAGIRRHRRCPSMSISTVRAPPPLRPQDERVRRGSGYTAAVSASPRCRSRFVLPLGRRVPLHFGERVRHGSGLGWGGNEHREARVTGECPQGSEVSTPTNRLRLVPRIGSLRLRIPDDEGRRKRGRVYRLEVKARAWWRATSADGRVGKGQG